MVHVLPVSDDGGSTAEIVRVLGGPAVGDIRSRCLRLAEDSNQEVQFRLLPLQTDRTCDPQPLSHAARTRGSERKGRLKGNIKMDIFQRPHPGLIRINKTIIAGCWGTLRIFLQWEL